MRGEGELTRKKRGFLILLMIFILLVSIGCQKKEQDTTDIQAFADPMAENILIAINQENYQEFVKDLSDKMQSELSEEIFDTQMVALKDIIGDYQEGSKEMLTTEDVDKNLIRVIYNTQYTNEKENVIVTVVFNKDENNRKIEGFFMNSPKLQKM